MDFTPAHMFVFTHSLIKGQRGEKDLDFLKEVVEEFCLQKSCEYWSEAAQLVPPSWNH